MIGILFSLFVSSIIENSFVLTIVASIPRRKTKNSEALKYYILGMQPANYQFTLPATFPLKLFV